MKILNSDIDINTFYQNLRKAGERILFLDYDGTLAPFQIEPEEAVPYPGVREILNQILQSKKTRLVIISGRWTRDLLPLLNLDIQPEIWGSHGLERLKPDGEYEIAKMEETWVKGLADADDWVAETGLEKRSEKKPGCLALHWRGMDEEEIITIKQNAGKTFAAIAGQSGLYLKEFDGGLELRAPGRNKGDAVRTVLSEAYKPFAAAYLGDDLTDEDAFKALKEKGISILVRNKFRSTHADIWISPPDELLKFLSEWLKLSGGEL